MFRSLARLLPTNAVFTVHPFQLSRWLEEAWSTAGTIPEFGPRTAGALPFLGSDEIIEALDLPEPVASVVPPPLASGISAITPDRFTGSVFAGTVPLVWDHLSYAYLIECTGIIEVMAEVIRRFAVGESLNTLSAQGTQWVRATEELFFRDPPLFSIGGIVSEVRPDLRVTRLNNYWRMFALELPHAIPARWRRPGYVDQSWKSDTGGVNTGFREKWTELLRQVWLGFENARNGIGPNATDREYVAFLCQSLRELMTARRQGGQLAREEFVHVTTMSWFHLTVETDTPIVIDLKAEATNPADRLAKIAQRVGVTPAPRARELFELSDLMSALLRAIEVGLFDNGADAETLFLPLAGNEALVRDMNRIIDLWQSATGDRVKDRAAGTAAQPLRLPGAAAAPPPVTPLPATPAPVPAGSAGTATVAATSMNGRG